ncbi:MAG: TIGR03086 family metal-binding protein [Actinomycetes bacterium]
MSELIDQIERATGITANVVAAVKPDQLDDPTPCTEWTVRDLLNHLIDTAELIASAGEGKGSAFNPMVRPDNVIGADPQGAYDAARTKLLTVWRERGTDGTVPLMQSQTPAAIALTVCMCDQLQHGWDLARAIGQDFEPDDDLITTAEDFTHQNMTADRRGPGKPFGYAIEPPPGASRVDQLAAFMGRHLE